MPAAAVFVVLYTTNLTQKRKKWHDGKCKFYLASRKVRLLDDEGRPLAERAWHDGMPEPGATVQFPRFMVELDELESTIESPTRPAPVQPLKIAAKRPRGLPLNILLRGSKVRLNSFRPEHAYDQSDSFDAGHSNRLFVDEPLTGTTYHGNSSYEMDSNHGTTYPDQSMKSSYENMNSNHGTTYPGQSVRSSYESSNSNCGTTYPGQPVKSSYESSNSNYGAFSHLDQHARSSYESSNSNYGTSSHLDQHAKSSYESMDHLDTTMEREQFLKGSYKSVDDVSSRNNVMEHFDQPSGIVNGVSHNITEYSDQAVLTPGVIDSVSHNHNITEHSNQPAISSARVVDGASLNQNTVEHSGQAVITSEIVDGVSHDHNTAEHSNQPVLTSVGASHNHNTEHPDQAVKRSGGKALDSTFADPLKSSYDDSFGHPVHADALDRSGPIFIEDADLLRSSQDNDQPLFIEHEDLNRYGDNINMAQEDTDHVDLENIYSESGDEEEWLNQPHAYNLPSDLESDIELIDVVNCDRRSVFENMPSDLAPTGPWTKEAYLLFSWHPPLIKRELP